MVVVDSVHVPIVLRCENVLVKFDNVFLFVCLFFRKNKYFVKVGGVSSSWLQ